MPIDYTKRDQQPARGDSDANAGVPAQPGQPTEPAPSRVVLTKAKPTVSLTKQAQGGVLRVNLDWNTGVGKGGGFFGRRRSGAIDLDLGCLYEFADGSKGVVQALGEAFHSLQTFGSSPAIWLDGDDRSGSRSGGENLFVDLAYLSQIRRILVFAFIYDGVPNWAEADGVVTLHPVSGPPIEVRLDESDPTSPMCAITMLDASDGTLAVSREVRYVKGSQRALDEAYGWGMSWTAGRK